MVKLKNYLSNRGLGTLSKPSSCLTKTLKELNCEKETIFFKKCSKCDKKLLLNLKEFPSFIAKNNSISNQTETKTSMLHRKTFYGN